MPIGTIEIPTTHITDEPLVCIPVNVDWIPAILAMVSPARYPEFWAGTLDENRRARREVQNLIFTISTGGFCDMPICCTPPYIIQRVNPDTGMVEISTNNGATWSPQPDSIPSHIVEPVPPVTSGVSATKCDAVQNCMNGIEDWITHVTNDFDTAVDILAFASAVLEAILAAIVAILSLGTLEGLEAAVLPLIGAACAAVFAAGKVAFADYWTDDVKKQIKCALFSNIGENGAFTDDQFSAYWNQVNLDMTGGIPKPLFIGFMSSIGRQGLNNMAASGAASGSDCSDCSPDTCDLDNWTIADGTLISQVDNVQQIEAVLSGGTYYVVAYTPRVAPFDICCKIEVNVISGTPTLPAGTIACGLDNTDSGNIDYPPLYPSCNFYIVTGSAPFTISVVYST